MLFDVFVELSVSRTIGFSARQQDAFTARWAPTQDNGGG